MMPDSEFLDFIDNMVSPEILDRMTQELLNNGNPNFIDLINLQERARILTIKERISSTHKWTKAICINEDNGARTECFWCEVCNLRCSTFEHINCLSIISKVRDKQPTYTIHNGYLKLSCSEVLNMALPGIGPHCFDCGIPERAKSNKCQIVDG